MGSILSYFIVLSLITIIYKIIQIVRALWLVINRASLRVVVSYAYLVFSRVFTSGYVNTETILHFFIIAQGSLNSAIFL